MKPYAIKQSPCPVCGYVPECAYKPHDPGKGPQPGQIGLCFKCGEALVFKEDMTLEVASLNDIMALSEGGRESLELYQHAIREARPLG